MQIMNQPVKAIKVAFRDQQVEVEFNYGDITAARTNEGGSTISLKQADSDVWLSIQKIAFLKAIAAESRLSEWLRAMDHSGRPRR